MSANIARRKLVKTLIASAGAATFMKTLPNDWHRPVIDVVTLPAHALTTNKKSKKKTVPQEE